MRCVLGPFLTCHLPHHRSDYFLSDTSETKEKNKSVQFTPHSDNECGHSLLGFKTDAAHIGTVPHLPPALTTDLIISYLMLVRQKRKTSQFSSNVQRERTRTWRGFGHGAASRLRDGEGSCGEYWGRSSPATCPHHRSDYFLPEASETKEKNKSVQFKRTARTNADMARLRTWRGK